LSTDTTGANNTAVGYNALLTQNGATGNVGVGAGAGDALTTGSNNVAIGLNAMGAETTGATNIAIGQNSMLIATLSLRCTSVGALSMDEMTTTCTDNTSVGYSSGGAITTGIKNTCIGASAGNTITTGANNTCVGYNAEPSAATVINTVTLGDANVTVLRCGVTTITAISDMRDKIDIEGLSVGLDLIRKLRPVQFRWNRRDGVNPTDDLVAGYIAQDLQVVQEEMGVQWLNMVNESNPDKLEAQTGILQAPMVLALQQLDARVSALEAARG